MFPRDINLTIKSNHIYMGFFDIFGKKQSPKSVVETSQEVDMTDTEKVFDQEGEKPSPIVTINYGTGMPIDAIYAFINYDYEQDGYQDALVNPSAEYCRTKETIILNQLQHLFRRVLLRYRGEIREMDVKIENAKSLFALTSASLLNARKDTCEEHISEINRMIEKVNSKSPEMMIMIDAYRRGFSKGCAAQTATFLNPKDD